MRFEGVYPPLVTPCDDAGRIDRTRFAELIERMVAAGVHGVILGGTTGEFYAQSLEERVEAMRFAAERLAGRLPLIVGVGAIRTEDSVSVALAAKAAGADGLMVASPPYACPTEEENAAHALEIDRAAGLPIILYNYPGRTGVSMGRTYLDRIGASPNFCAIKESSGDPARLRMIACDYPGLQLSCGADDQALEFFAWGARSWVAAGANFMPAEHIALWRACVVDADFGRGRRIMAAMLPLLKVLEQGGKFVQCVKHGLTLAGVPAGAPRRPLLPLTQAEQEELAQVIGEVRASVAGIEAERAAAAE